MTFAALAGDILHNKALDTDVACCCALRVVHGFRLFKVYYRWFATRVNLGVSASIRWPALS